MRKRWQAAAGFACGLAVIAGGALSVSADTGHSVRATKPSSVMTSARSGAADLLRSVGIGEDDESAGAGTIDDGKELLPKATISLDEALQAAQTHQSGEPGEVDLEYFEGRLVYNVDAGDHDVKVDAETGTILGSVVD